MTPMATQLTFEGLIDELFGIDCCKFIINNRFNFYNHCLIIFCYNIGTVELPADKFVSEEDNVNTLTRKKIVLNSNDEIFDETRYAFY